MSGITLDGEDSKASTLLLLSVVGPSEETAADGEGSFDVSFGAAECSAGGGDDSTHDNDGSFGGIGRDGVGGGGKGTDGGEDDHQ